MIREDRKMILWILLAAGIVGMGIHFYNLIMGK